MLRPRLLDRYVLSETMGPLLLGFSLYTFILLIRFLFQSARHREALAQLIYVVRERKGFLVLTGEIGTGKTTLLRTLLEKLDATYPTVAVISSAPSASRGSRSSPRIEGQATPSTPSGSPSATNARSESASRTRAPVEREAVNSCARSGDRPPATRWR